MKSNFKGNRRPRSRPKLTIPEHPRLKGYFEEVPLTSVSAKASV